MYKHVVLLRNIHEDKQELGNFMVFSTGGKKLFECRSLELPWKDNQQNISCAPPGVYPIHFEMSNAFKRPLWELKNVPGRSEIKIHVANYHRQLRGCIALGDMFIDLDNDGYRDVRNSAKTLNRFHEVMAPLNFSKIHIVNIS